MVIPPTGGGASDAGDLTAKGISSGNLLTVSDEIVVDSTPAEALASLTDSKIIRVGNYLISGLPTNDPLVLNALWNDSGTIKVSAGSTLNNGLVSYWNLDDETGDRVNLIEGENSAVPVNGPTATPGLVGKAAQLKTANPARYFTVPATSSGIPTTGTRTWAFVAKWDSLSTQPGLFQADNGTDWYALLLGALNIVRFRLATGITNSLDSQPVITTPGVWHVIRLWYDAAANEMGIQIDGNTKVTKAISGTPAWASTGWHLGRVGSFAHDGVMDEIAVWDRMLTDTEWLALRTAWLSGYGHPFDDYGLPAIEIFSPTAYRTFQRDGSDLADITIVGRVRNAAGDVEARWNDGTWVIIASAVSGDFSASLANQSAGQGTLEVRLADYTDVNQSVSYVGIGDVFVIAGQSNASGRGTNYQGYGHATLKATIFANDGTWKEMADPTDSVASQLDSVSADTGLAAGSIWPLLATSIMANQNVPIAFVPCAMGSTSITAWQPGANHVDRTTLYGSMNYRAQIAGAKIVLWWQGETDALAAMAQATYNGHLDTLAAAIASDIGCKIMPCRLQNSSGISDANEAAINAAIAEAWSDNVNVLPGPDLSDIGSDDAYHLQGDVKLATAASRWWSSLQSALYS